MKFDQQVIVTTKALGGRVGSKRNAGVSERVKNETVEKKRYIFSSKGGWDEEGNSNAVAIDISFFRSDATCIRKIALLILFFVPLFPIHSLATFNPVVGWSKNVIP